MACVVVGLFFMLMSGVLTAYVSKIQARLSQRKNALRKLAQRNRGQFRSDGIFGGGRVNFRYGEAIVVVTSERADPSGANFEFNVTWPDRRMRLYVGMRAGQESPGVDPEVAIDDQPFARLYRVTGSVPADAVAFLSPAVRWQLEKIRHLTGSNTVQLVVSSGRFVLRKRLQTVNYPTLEALSSLVLDLYDQSLLTQSAGIEFVQPESAQVIQQAICQVCSEDIDVDMVLCRRCKTPHHRDCWQYYGACTTYGCGETVYLIPKVARPYVVDKDN